MNNYDKHKDASPEETIARIQKILTDIGVCFEEKMMKSARNVYSVFFSSPQYRAFVNGKGTQESYCRASAYGEAMERIQNGYFYNKGYLSERAISYGGFYRLPDEELLDIQQAAVLAPSVYSELKECYEKGIRQKEDRDVTREEILRFWKNYLHTPKISCADFFHVSKKTVARMPEQLISAVCGSNGLAAGNTPEEAICQGICEALERHVKYRIMQEKLTMPDIPRDFVKKYAEELAVIIEDIESKGDFTVYVKDATLGEEYPVLCALLVDRKNQRYHIKFGADRSFHVALERCLTEILQGYQLGDPKEDLVFLTPWSRTKQEEFYSAENLEQMIRSDVGVVPDECLTGSPSWEFRPWRQDTEKFTNAQALKYLVSFLSEHHFDLYVRDNSYLGFPSYRIYIPGMTTTHLPYSYKKIRDARVKSALEAIEKNGDHFDREQLETVIEFMKRCQYEWNGISYPYGIPRDVITAGIYMRLGNTKEAVSCLRNAHGRKRAIWNCAARELELLEDGRPEDRRDALLAMFFGEEVLEKVKKCWRFGRPEEFSFSNLFQCLKQDEAENEAADEAADEKIEKEKQYREDVSSLHMRLKDRMKTGMPDQKMLSKIFN